MHRMTTIWQKPPRKMSDKYDTKITEHEIGMVVAKNDNLTKGQGQIRVSMMTTKTALLPPAGEHMLWFDVSRDDNIHVAKAVSTQKRRNCRPVAKVKHTE